MNVQCMSTSDVRSAAHHVTDKTPAKDRTLLLLCRICSNVFCVVRLEQFVLLKVHALDNISAGVKHTPDVFCVYGSGEVGIAEMSTIVGFA